MSSKRHLTLPLLDLGPLSKGLSSNLNLSIDRLTIRIPKHEFSFELHYLIGPFKMFPSKMMSTRRHLTLPLLDLGPLSKGLWSNLNLSIDRRIGLLHFVEP